MEYVVKLNDKSQIVISKALRRTLGLSPGDELAATVENDKIVLRPKPKNCAARLRGMGRGTWGNRAAIDRYIEKLRDEWKRA